MTDEELEEWESNYRASFYGECSCGEPWVGVLVQCDKHHGIGCYCNGCMM